MFVKYSHDVFVKNTAMADAEFDRLVEAVHRFELTSDNMRNNRIFAAPGLKR